MAIQTANTIQTDDTFLSVNWIDEKIILNQLNTLLSKFKFKYIKIGLIPSLNTLNKLIDLCVKSNSNAKIIWDPILSASAGFNFNHDLSKLKNTLKHIYLITPNWNEIKILTNKTDEFEGAIQLSKYCKILLKGGHHPTEKGKDYLFENGNKKAFNAKAITFYPKHGSGCVLSSAITANLANGYPLKKSILRSKRYTERFLASSQSLIGRHKL